TKMLRNARIPKEPWHAVSVVAPAQACPAVVKLGRRRFLSFEAPELPLPQCSSAWRYQCIYRHFSDRRAALRRGSDRSEIPGPRIGAERRTTRGRRATDGVAFKN